MYIAKRIFFIIIIFTMFLFSACDNTSNVNIDEFKEVATQYNKYPKMMLVEIDEDGIDLDSALNFFIANQLGDPENDYSQYFNNETYEYTIPKDIVDDYINKYFSKVVFSETERYDALKNSYTLFQYGGSNFSTYNIKDIERGKNNIFTFECETLNNLDYTTEDYEVTLIQKFEVDTSQRTIKIKSVKITYERENFYR